MRLGIDQPAVCLEALGDDLIWCHAVEHALAARVVGGIEAAQQMLEVPVGIDGDTEAWFETGSHAKLGWRCRDG